MDVSPSKNYVDGLVITECNGSESQKWDLQSVSWT